LKNLEQIYEENPIQILKETKKFLSILNQELADHLSIYEQTTKDLLHEIVRQREKSRDVDIFKTQKNSLSKENENLKETVRTIEQENKTLTEDLKKARQRILSLEENKTLLSVECAKIKQEATMLHIKLAENGSKEELGYIRERLTAERDHSNKLQQQVDQISKNVHALEDQKEALKLMNVKEQTEVK
jgi:chromosome segregation ATPase